MTALPSIFGGVTCPKSMSYGRVHGTSAATGNVTMEGIYIQPLGVVNTIQLGSGPPFVGYVTNVEVSESEEGLTETKIHMVDWRDRLHDKVIFGAFNMRDDKGRWYHIFPHHWTIQRKTFLNRELEEQDFDSDQDDPVPDDPSLEVFGCENIFSAATLLNALAIYWGIVWYADAEPLDALVKCRPENVDWNNGVSLANAISGILQQAGLTFSAFGTNEIQIVKRGYSENNFIKGYLSGSSSFCSTGASSGRRGEQYNEKGRRVLIIGGRNKYEYTFPCVPNWNRFWDYHICFGPALALFMKANGVSLLSSLGDLPEKYRDPDKWNGKPRNEMTIQEYIENICWKVFIMDAEHVIETKTPTIIGSDFNATFNPIDRETLEVDDMTSVDLATWRADTWESGDGDEGPFRKEYNALFPVSPKMVSDSNLQFIGHATTRKILKSSNEPLELQKTFVPFAEGISIEVEEVLDKEECREEYRVRLVFSSSQFFVDITKARSDDGYAVKDIPLAELSLDKELYLYAKGELGSAPKLREIRHSEGSIFKSFINGNEVDMLQENFTEDLEDGGAAPAVKPVKADHVAERLASQLLFHNAVIASGNLTGRGHTGILCDGLVESVQLSWDQENGSQESLNCTSEYITEERTFNISSGKVKTARKTDQDLMKEIQDNMLKARNAAANDKGKITPPASKTNTRSMDSTAEQSRHYDRSGNLAYNAPQGYHTDTLDIENGQVLVANNVEEV